MTCACWVHVRVLIFVVSPLFHHVTSCNAQSVPVMVEEMTAVPKRCGCAAADAWVGRRTGMTVTSYQLRGVHHRHRAHATSWLL